tara:strand:- start:498 stop:698 length:201 start_codon:yes stop_codon:yes gene_type:complete
MTWKLRSFGSWYLVTDRTSSKDPGKIVAWVWKDADGFWHWSTHTGKESKKRIRDVNQAKRSAKANS